MKNNSTQQEILLLTNTGFASRQYAERDMAAESKHLPATEKLKEACWNGLLKEILPEIFLLNNAAAKLVLWQVREANRFFALEMSDCPAEINKYFSIDPYRFMEVAEYN